MWSLDLFRRESNMPIIMDDWRMDCFWWLVLSGIPVKRSASLFSMYHASDDCTIETEGP